LALDIIKFVDRSAACRGTAGAAKPKFGYRLMDIVWIGEVGNRMSAAAPEPGPCRVFAGTPGKIQLIGASQA